MDQLIPVAVIAGVTVVMAVTAWQALGIPREAARREGSFSPASAAVEDLRRRVEALEQERGSTQA